MEYIDQLRSLARRLSDANTSLLVWDEIEAQKRLPGPQRGQAPPRPKLSRQALKLQLILLIADMCRLEQEISAARVLSTN